MPSKSDSNSNPESKDQPIVNLQENYKSTTIIPVTAQASVYSPIINPDSIPQSQVNQAPQNTIQNRPDVSSSHNTSDSGSSNTEK